ncbi:TonB-dependent receptor domain-containing protein [Moellerella wisconsensis]|uniref:TonB-dependent receptor domain-containing protein n=1 Tax=Moellerella wisconsensis TaxID=158849 RepID=UPI0024102E53|nr:TonB-dependent receptor [Moellerella wisconsensis]
MNKIIQLIPLGIFPVGIMLITITQIAQAQAPNSDNSQQARIFRPLKISGSTKNTPSTQALERPGAYSALSVEYNLQSLDSAIRTLPGVYTQMDGSQGAVNVNIRGLSGLGRVNMMVDGVSQSYYGISPSQYTHGQQPYSQFGSMIDPNFIVALEVEKGQLNGGNSINALAGSANFRTLAIDDVIFSPHVYGIRSKTRWGNNGIGYNGMLALGTKIALNSSQGYIGGLLALSGHNIPGNYKNGDGINSDEFATDSTFKQRPKSQLAKINYKANDFHQLELSGRWYQNKLTRRNINTKDYFIKYNYTPFNDFIDSEVLLSNSQSHQDFSGDSLGWALRQGNSYHQSWAMNGFNTSRFSLHNIDYQFTLGSKLIATKYHRQVSTVSTVDTMIRNPFSPSGKQNLASAYAKLKMDYQIYTAEFDINYTYYDVKGHKPACDAREKCFPEGAADFRLKHGGFNPGVLLSAEIIPEFQPFASYAYSMRAPNAQEAFFSNEGGASMNPFLKGEKAQTVQLGFNSYRPDLVIAGDALRLKALWYHSKLTDYIYSRGYILCRTHADDEYHRCLNNDDAFDNYDVNANVSMYIYQNNPDKVTLHGYELQADYDAGLFYSTLSYSKESSNQPMSVTYSSDAFSAGDISELPEYYLSLDSGIRLLDKRLKLGTLITITGPSKRITPSGERNESGDIMTEQYEQQPTIIDLYAKYTINRQIKLMFSVNNITNRSYSDALNRANSSAKISEKDQHTARGRTYMLGAAVRF